MEPRVLVVTPERQLRGMLRRKLEQWRMQFLTASDIGEAVSVLEVEPVDVVVLDIRHHRTDVEVILATMKRSQSKAETIIINSTGNVAASISAMRAGAVDELTVPIEEADLKEKLLVAWDKANAKQKTKKKRGILKVFSDAMAAATFAQSGDSDMAERFLDGQIDENVRDFSPGPAKRKP